MRRKPSQLFIPALLLAGCAAAPEHEERPGLRPSFPDAGQLPVQGDLPDPLVMLDGRRVTTPEGWWKERRPELEALVQHYMYGYLPPPPR
ncbi:MAG: hypothetical protein HY721_26615, partial [Planctomycetes bacterium]|nr:hypothetical protein [Planctomycetota bacterium]